METFQQNSLILNNNQDTVYHTLYSSLETCKKFYFNVAFVNFSGLQLFVDFLSKLNEKGIHGKIITSTYLNFSDPKALKILSNYENLDMKVYNDTKRKGFHSKAYIFEYEDYYKVIIGSSNLTQSALKSNVEWNVEIISKKTDPFINEVLEEFTEIWDSLDEVTDEFLNEYENFINKLKDYNKKNPVQFEYKKEIIPNTMQQRAISNLEKLRNYGEKRALVIAATGTGKTFMSAFDVKQYHPKKMLFIVHREEILRKAEESFKKVFNNENLDTGFFTGKQKQYEQKFIFSTIQTLHKHYDLFDQDEFDYIVLDEAHHAAGDSYQKVLNYFNPNFLLGMTATPERCDNADIFEMFDNNVAIEVRLHEAMEEELVVPFHYFGITDIDEVHLEGINMDDTAAVAKALKINQRVDYIVEQMNLYGYDGDKRKCLGFCVNIDHAKFMCDEFNKRGIKSACLTGDDSSDLRQSYMKRLENEEDELEVIFTVDIFNEGVDIPSVNLVLMLRPTNSPIIFIQQLGRGLRKSKNKEFLTVLDFIGNHNRAFLIAIALKGSRYYDKDSLKVSVKNDFMNIPGSTFVKLDPISKERILQQLEFENFNSMKYLKEEYLSFKALLKGRVPRYLMDYLKYEGAPDPIKFIRKEGTYLEFLSKMEDYSVYKELCANKEYMKYLKYISDMLPLKRSFEFAILLDLISKKKMRFEDCKQSIHKYIEYIDDDSVKHSIETLNFEFYDSSQKTRWNPFIIKHENYIELDPTLTNYLNDQYKKNYILDSLHFGLSLYRQEFEEKNYGLPFFKLYSQYSMQEVALVSNYRKTHSSFRGSGLLTNGNEYYLFVDLHKDANIKESINYKDKFISRKKFQWQSPNSTKQDSQRGLNIIHNKERGINLHLFVRKFKEIDRQIQPYIYVGKINTYEYEGNQPITIQTKLEHELPSKLYEELINKVEIKNDTKN